MVYILGIMFRQGDWLLQDKEGQVSSSRVVNERTVDVVEMLKCQFATCSAKMGERVPLSYCLACGNEGCPGYVRAEYFVNIEGIELEDALNTCRNQIVI